MNFDIRKVNLFYFTDCTFYKHEQTFETVHISKSCFIQTIEEGRQVFALLISPPSSPSSLSLPNGEANQDQTTNPWEIHGQMARFPQIFDSEEATFSLTT